MEYVKECVHVLFAEIVHLLRIREEEDGIGGDGEVEWKK